MGNLSKMVATLLLLISNSAFASDEVVRIVLPNWDGAKYIAYHLGKQIGEKTGRSVEYVEMKTDSMWVELDKDNGKVDIFPDLWMPNQEHNWNKYVTEKQSVVPNDNPYEGKQGFYMLTNGMDIAAINITDISDSMIKKLDTDNNGLAEYWPGDPSWHALVFNRVKLKSYGLYEKFEEIKQDSETFLNTLNQKLKEKQPLMFYYWEPDWIHAKYPLKLIKEPLYSEGCKKIIDPSEDKKWFEKSNFNCAFPKSHVYVVFRDEYLQDKKLGPLLQNYKVVVKKLQEAILTSRKTGQNLKEIAQSN